MYILLFSWVYKKLIFLKDVLNLGVNNGNPGPPLGWGENSLKHEKCNRSERTDYGFSINIHINVSQFSRNARIFFSSQIDQSALTETASQIGDLKCQDDTNRGKRLTKGQFFLVLAWCSQSRSMRMYRLNIITVDNKEINVKNKFLIVRRK